MGVMSTWDNEVKTIIRVDFEGEWTWDEFESAQHELKERLDSVDHKADIIVVLGTGTVPQGALAKFSTIVTTPAFAHPNAGLLAIVGANDFTKTLADIFAKLHQREAKKVTLVCTIEEAYEALIEHWRAQG